MSQMGESAPTGSPTPTAGPDSGGGTSLARPGLVLLLLCLAEFMIVVDFSITNVALPSIRESLGFSSNDLQWVVSAYALGFGGFLLLGGRISDLYGRRRMFIVGLVAFAVVSLVAGLAQDAIQLIVLRGLQGLTAAFVAPAALSLLTTSFPEGPERNRAIGVYGAVLSFGFVAGVFFGGLLTELLNWRWVFFVNVPIGIVAALCAPLLVQESRDEQVGRKLDLPGAFTITASLISLVYGLSTAHTNGWSSPTTWGTLLLAVVLFAAFVLIEQRTDQPLVPLQAVMQRVLLGANLVNILIIGAFVGVTFMMTLHLQYVEGYTPLQTGLSFTVLGATAVAAGLLASRTSARFGMIPTLVGGLVLQFGGTLLIAVLPVRGALLYILVGSAIVGFGHVSAVVMVTISATAGVADEEQGLASGLLNTTQQIGAALGAAVFTAIAATQTTGLLPPGVSIDAADGLSLASGYRVALVSAACTAAVAAVVALLVLGRRTVRSVAGP